MTIHDHILDHAPGHDPSAAARLHEELWLELLFEEASEVHNLRLARSDAVVDGVRFVDPILGSAIVYQPMFCSHLGEAQKAQIVTSFVAAQRQPFPCQRWTLLVSIELTAADLEWLLLGLRKAALVMAGSEWALSAAIDQCALDFRDGRDLLGLARRHLSIVARRLPQLVRGLAEQRYAAREQESHTEAELVDRLRFVQDAMIRQRTTEGQQALGALNLLNQGWAEQITAVSPLISFPLRPDGGNIAGALLKHCERRMRDALAIDGLLAGIFAEVLAVHAKAQQLSDAISSSHGTAASQIANGLVGSMKTLQARIGLLHGMLFRPG